MYDDIEEVEGDLGRVTKLFKEILKIQDVTVLRDATYVQLKKCFNKLKKKYNAANKTGDPLTLFLIWYGGHGELGSSSFT